jgi:hypothetical protein
MNRHNYNDVSADDIKARVTIYEVGELLCQDVNLRKNPCSSPFREDRKPSFSVFDDGTYWKDQGTGEQGDVIQFVAKKLGLDCKRDFPRIVQWFAERFPGIGGTADSAPKRDRKEKKQVEPLTPDQRAACSKSIERLLTNPDEVAQWRGWKSETIKQLATEGNLGLWIGGEVVFMHAGRPKTRVMDDRTGSKQINWPFKGSNTLWRSERITSDTRRVIVAEGETDSITLIDCGMEQDGETVIVAVPGASNGLRPYLDLFKGRDVVLAYDDDDEGILAMHKSRRLVGKVASDVYVMDLHLDDAAMPVKDVTDLRDARGGLTADEIQRRFMAVPKLKLNLDAIERWVETLKGDGEVVLINFLRPSEILAYEPPAGSVLVGDNHIVKGDVFVIGGAPGIGKSRSAVSLAEAGARGADWFGYEVHRKFKTMVLQNENGQHRLKNELSDIKADMEDWVRISPPPPLGLQWTRKEFRDQLRRAIEDFQPDVFIIDPWNATARDNTQKDYLEAFELIQTVLPSGDRKPALGIVAHTRKAEVG